jgi:hypothetical protein
MYSLEEVASLISQMDGDLTEPDQLNAPMYRPEFDDAVSENGVLTMGVVLTPYKYEGAVPQKFIIRIEHAPHD